MPNLLTRKRTPAGVPAAGWTYASETGFLEALLQSPHRTLNPEEAGEPGAQAWQAGQGFRLVGRRRVRPEAPGALPRVPVRGPVAAQSQPGQNWAWPHL